MAFQQFTCPALPFGQKSFDRLHLSRAGQAQQQLPRRGGRAGAGVEHGDRHLAPREGLVEHRQVANDQGHEAEADAGLGHRQEAAQRPRRGDFAEAEGEERLAAEVKIGSETDVVVGGVQAGAEGGVQEGETENQACDPGAEQEQDGQRAEETEEVLPPLSNRQPHG